MSVRDTSGMSLSPGGMKGKDKGKKGKKGEERKGKESGPESEIRVLPQASFVK